MNDDLFTYEVVVPKLSCTPNVDHGVDGLVNDDLDIYEPQRLVRVIDVPIEQWLDLIYGDHTKIDKKIKEVISRWLIRSYQKHFNEYIEMKKKLVEHGVDADMEYDLSDVNFA
ncbi:hypothetical protein Tco_1338723 [Tanacetum coccineum]